MDNFDYKNYLKNNPLLSENLEEGKVNLSKQTVNALISIGNEYTKDQKEELEDYFNSVLNNQETKEKGIEVLNKLIEDIKKEEITNDDIIEDLVDSWGGDYQGAFSSRGWGSQDDEDDEDED